MNRHDKLKFIHNIGCYSRVANQEHIVTISMSEDSLINILDKYADLKNKKQMKNRVFLGGTVANSTWRDQMIEKLKIDYFNPVVDDWTEEMVKIEDDEKSNKCNIHYYCITNEMKGVYSIAEMVDSSHNKDKICICQIIPDGFDEHQLKSLKQVSKIINNTGSTCIIDSNLNHSIDALNKFKHIG